MSNLEWEKPLKINPLGENTVKWTPIERCIGLNRNDSKIYTKFKLYEEKIINNIKTHWSQRQNISNKIYIS